jgi:hypothetical protein
MFSSTCVNVSTLSAKNSTKPRNRCYRLTLVMLRAETMASVELKLHCARQIFPTSIKYSITCCKKLERKTSHVARKKNGTLRRSFFSSRLQISVATQNLQNASQHKSEQRKKKLLDAREPVAPFDTSLDVARALTVALFHRGT